MQIRAFAYQPVHAEVVNAIAIQPSLREAE